MKGRIIFLDALAGTGKTTSIERIVKKEFGFGKDVKVLAIGFVSATLKALLKRFPNCSSCTLHSLGYTNSISEYFIDFGSGTVYYNNTQTNDKIVDKNRTKQLREYLEDLGIPLRSTFAVFNESTPVDTDAIYSEIYSPSPFYKRLLDFVHSELNINHFSSFERMLSTFSDKSIDIVEYLNDYIMHKYKNKTDKSINIIKEESLDAFDVVVFDECQDLPFNFVQNHIKPLTEYLVGSGKTVIFAGDLFQSIYAALGCYVPMEIVSGQLKGKFVYEELINIINKLEGSCEVYRIPLYKGWRFENKGLAAFYNSQYDKLPFFKDYPDRRYEDADYNLIHTAVGYIQFSDFVPRIDAHNVFDDVYVLSHSHMYSEGTAYYLIHLPNPIYTLQNTLLNLYVSKARDGSPLFEYLIKTYFKYGGRDKESYTKNTLSEIKGMYKYIDLICDTIYMLQKEPFVKWWNPHLFAKALINDTKPKDDYNDPCQTTLSTVVGRYYKNIFYDKNLESKDVITFIKHMLDVDKEYNGRYIKKRFYILLYILYSHLKSKQEQNRYFKYKHKIQFNTIHSTKGLEADTVYYLHFSSYGIGTRSIAVAKRLNMYIIDDNRIDMCVYNVAITRAKKKLYFVFAQDAKSESLIEKVCEIYGRYFGRRW